MRDSHGNVQLCFVTVKEAVMKRGEPCQKRRIGVPYAGICAEPMLSRELRKPL